jgi:hypothetical protein
MKAKRGVAVKDAQFEESHDWFDRFKKRSNLHNIKVQGEAAAAESGYMKDEIFNVDEMGLFWKMTSETIIAREERTMPGFKPAKDRLALLLGAKASQASKLKPMLIYHSEKPTAFKNYVKIRLPVHWRSHAKAWIIAALFKEWSGSCFVPEVSGYC